KWDDDQYFTMLNAPVDFEPAHAVTNARFGYTTADSRWDVSAFIRNLTDRRYRVYNLDLSPLGFNQSVYAPPRLWGVTLAYHLRHQCRTLRNGLQLVRSVKRSRRMRICFRR